MEPQPSTDLQVEFEPLRPKRSSKLGPSNLIYNIIASHEGKIFLLGGNSLTNKSFDQYFKNVYVFHPEECVWMKKEFPLPQTNVENEQRGEDGMDEESHSIYSRFNQSWCQIGNKLYVFGGSNYKNENNKQFYVFNMTDMEWEQIKANNQPEAREGAAMTSVKQKYIALYGGINAKSMEIFDKLWIFQIQASKWIQAKGSFNNIFRVRPKVSMCSVGDDLYFFGGQGYVETGQYVYLNDFHVLKGNWSTYNFKAEFIRPVDGVQPEGRSFCSLIPIFKKYILMIGGQRKEREESDFNQNLDIYSVEEKVWRKIRTNISVMRLSLYNCVGLQNGEMYITQMHDSGGLGLGKGKIQEDSVVKHFSEVRKQLDKHCVMCNLRERAPQMMPKYLIDGLVQAIDFAFSAFGVLIENSLNHHCTMFKITYEEQPQKSFKIEENNEVVYTEDELIESVGNFQSVLSFSFSNMEKKAKNLILREMHMKQYGMLIKMAALRLGEEFCYISSNRAGQMIVCCFSLTQDNMYYRYDYYVYYIKNNKLSQKSSQRMYNYIIGKHKEQIESVMQKIREVWKEEDPSQQIKKPRDNYYNNLFIKRLRMAERKDSPQPIQEIVASPDITDLIFSAYRQFKKAVVRQSIDISLVTYLSLLFLKNQTMKIYLKVGTKETKINSQMYLEVTDRMVKNKLIHEMDNSFLGIDQIKTLQLYYNPQLVPATPSFHNGVLIYHRNRLIKRHGCPLGHLYRYMSSNRFNYFSLFGVLEVPEAVTPNIFKTDFMYNIMMQKLSSRLIHIEEELRVYGSSIRQKNIKKGKGREFNEKAEGEGEEVSPKMLQ